MKDIIIVGIVALALIGIVISSNYKVDQEDKHTPIDNNIRKADIIFEKDLDKQMEMINYNLVLNSKVSKAILDILENSKCEAKLKSIGGTE